MTAPITGGAGGRATVAPCACYLAASLAVVDIRLLAAILLSEIAAAWVLGRMGSGLRRWAANIRPGLMAGMGIALVNAAFGPGSTELLNLRLPVGAFRITLEALLTGVAMMLRLVCAMGAFSLLRVVSDEDELFFFLSRPFSKISLALAMALRLAPYVGGRVKAIYEVQRVRGREVGRAPLFQYVRARAPVVRAAVCESLELSLNLAEAMFARGWGSGGRSRYPSSPFGLMDATVLISSATALLMLVGARVPTSIADSLGTEAGFWLRVLAAFLPLAPHCVYEVIRCLR